MRKRLFLILIGLFFILSIINIVYAEIIFVSNNYISAGIDNKTGRIVINTIEGDPTNPFDNNKPLLYSKVPQTSFVAININGETVIYGTQKGKWIRKPYIEGEKLSSTWQYKKITIICDLMPVHNPSTGFPDNILIYCSILNGGRMAKIGAAIVLDVQLGEKEPKFFNIIERGLFSNETQVAKDDIPLYWYTVDDIENQTIKVQGILKKYGAIKPDRVVFATWDRLSDLWEFKLNSSYDFRRRGTFQYDGAVGIFYDPRELDYNAILEAATIYGVMGSNVLTEEDFLLTLNIPKEPKELPIPIVGMFVNRSPEEIEKLSLEINLPEGFFLENGEKKVEALKIQPGGTFQTKWEISTEGAGGNFYVNVKADITQKKQLKTMELNESFFANFYKKSDSVKKTPREMIERKTEEFIPLPKKEETLLSVNKLKLKKIEKLISEIDQVYENWVEIYKTVFQDKNYSIEQIDKALDEIEKEIDYFHRIITNEINKE